MSIARLIGMWRTTFGSINAYMRQLKNLGAIHGGSAWLNDELNTAENLAGWLYRL
ncbi:hypothetical protein [Escherichia coli]|uniref:hypothetical protein n=1 Tax=Escherichia coli TaxID=562 RepID=UPI00202D0844|nr:hypothetical protein [Escherichia coli]